MLIRKTDKENKFVSMFNTVNGFYMRSGVLDEHGKDTGVDPFMASFPELIDIGIMGSCVHGLTGKCKQSGIQCYQHGDIAKNANMTLDNYKSIMDECEGKVFQVALGGCGDPDMHPDIEEILKYTRSKQIVPSFTTSGLGMTTKKAEMCKQYCGAVAVSMYSRLVLNPMYLIREASDGAGKVYNGVSSIPTIFDFGGYNPKCTSEESDSSELIIDGKQFTRIYINEITNEMLTSGKYELYRVYYEKYQGVSNGNFVNYTFKSIDTLLKTKVKTNIHFVLSKSTIYEAILRLKYNGFPDGINAVIFLLHKPVGLGSESEMLRADDPKVLEFFNLIDTGNFKFKIGFDSCTVPGILNYMHTVNKASIDTCEAARWSMYITPDMKALPCSFDNQDQKYAVDIKEVGNIKSAWNSDKFNEIRAKFNRACPNCKNRAECMGGCPLMNNITLCKNKH